MKIEKTPIEGFLKLMVVKIAYEPLSSQLFRIKLFTFSYQTEKLFIGSETEYPSSV